MNEKRYTITAPLGNVLAPLGEVTESQLRDFGVKISGDETWREKFTSEPFENVLEYFRMANYDVKEI